MTKPTLFIIPEIALSLAVSRTNLEGLSLEDVLLYLKYSVSPRPADHIINVDNVSINQYLICVLQKTDKVVVYLIYNQETFDYFKNLSAKTKEIMLVDSFIANFAVNEEDRSIKYV